MKPEHDRLGKKHRRFGTADDSLYALFEFECEYPQVKGKSSYSCYNWDWNRVLHMLK